MSKHISDEDLEILHLKVSGELRRRGSNDNRKEWIEPIWISVDARVLSPLLDELRRRRQGNGRKGSFRLGHVTKVLMSMKIGDVVEVEPITMGALKTCRTTARKHLGVLDAVWHSRTQENGLVKITRAPNGSPEHAKYHNPAIYTLANMKIGEILVVDTLKGKMHNAIKIHARKIMDNSKANWKCNNLANGSVRVERIR